MVKLPFVVQPKRKPINETIGSEESGYLEIERRGYLTTGEKAFVQQALSLDDSTVRIIGLARKVSNDYNIKIEDAYDKVMKIITGSDRSDEELKQIEFTYFSEFNEVITELSRMSAKEEMITAMALLRYRVNNDISVDDVMQLHPDLISDLAKLYKDEENKSIEKFKQLEESDEAASEQDNKIDIEAIEKKPSKRTTRTG